MLTTVFQHLRGEIGFGGLGGMVYLCANIQHEPATLCGMFLGYYLKAWALIGSRINALF